MDGGGEGNNSCKSRQTGLNDYAACRAHNKSLLSILFIYVYLSPLPRSLELFLSVFYHLYVSLFIYIHFTLCVAFSFSICLSPLIFLCRFLSLCFLFFTYLSSFIYIYFILSTAFSLSIQHVSPHIYFFTVFKCSWYISICSSVSLSHRKPFFRIFYLFICFVFLLHFVLLSQTFFSNFVPISSNHNQSIFKCWSRRHVPLL